LGDFRHFCAHALVDAIRQWACKHARSSRFSQQSRLPWLGLAQFCGRKPIFSAALNTFLNFINFKMDDIVALYCISYI
jgi:hypothetical protein